MKRYDVFKISVFTPEGGDAFPDTDPRDGECAAVYLAEDVQQLARTVEDRIGHKEECERFYGAVLACDCGYEELHNALVKIISGESDTSPSRRLPK